MAELGREFPEVKKMKDTTIKRCQKNQFSKSKWNQTGNQPDPRMLDAAENPIREST